MKVTPKTEEWHRIKVYGYLPAMPPEEYQKVCAQIKADSDQWCWGSPRAREVVISSSHICDIARARLVAKAMRDAGLTNVHWIRKTVVTAKEFV